MNDKQKEKLRKLMALGESSNPHESALAIKRAQQYLEKWGLEASALSHLKHDNSQTESNSIPSEIREWENELGWLISRAFGCIHLMSDGGFCFIGEGSTASVASYAFDVLYRNLCESRLRYMVTNSKPNASLTSKMSLGNHYASAYVLSLKKEVYTFALTEEKKQELTEYRDSIFPCLGKAQKAKRPRKHKDQEKAMRQGFADGSKVKLHHGVDGDAKDQINLFDTKGLVLK